MTKVGATSRECPSWARLLRFVAEGGPWPAEHLRTCSRCSERREFLESLSIEALLHPVAPSGRLDCPEPGEIVSLIDEDLSREHRGRLAEHVSDCEACAALLRELLAVTAEDVGEWEVREGAPIFESSEASSELGRGFLAGTFVKRAAAVLVVAAALLAVYFVPFPAVDTGSADRWRGPASRLEARVVWPRSADIPTLRWEGWDEAASYRVRVWNEDGQRSFERHLGASETLDVQLIVEGAAVGQVFLWQVDALSGGEVIASTGL